MKFDERPVRLHETVHDYSLLQNMRDDRQTVVIPADPPSRGENRIPLALSVLSLAVAACAFLYAHFNALPPLVPGTHANSTVIVDANGRIVSVANGETRAAIMVAPVEYRQEPSGILPTVPAPSVAVTGATEGHTRLFPWSQTPVPPPAPVTPGSVIPASVTPSPDVSSSTAGASGMPATAVPEHGQREDGAATFNPPDASGATAAGVVENFVKFQPVGFKTGVVDTAWLYTDSNATEPADQWCYYKDLAVETKGLQPTLSFPFDHRDDADPEALGALGLTREEYEAARGKCRWFNATSGR